MTNAVYGLPNQGWFLWDYIINSLGIHFQHGSHGIGLRPSINAVKVEIKVLGVFPMVSYEYDTYFKVHSVL